MKPPAFSEEMSAREDTCAQLVRENGELRGKLEKTRHELTVCLQLAEIMAERIQRFLKEGGR